MTAESRSVVVRLSMEAADYIRTAQQAGAVGADAMSKVEGGAHRSSKALDDLGRTSGRVALLAAAGVGAIVLSTTKFESAMSAVEAATHETEANMGALRQAALDAGQATVFSATESAGAIEELAKAGISTNDILAGGLKGSLDLAAAGTIAVGDAAEFTATALTQFRLGGEQATHVADLLAAGAGKAQGSVTDMALALDYAGIPASQLGASIEETAGTLALFASNGLIGEKAGTGLRGMLSSLVAPSVAAQKTMDQYGITIFDTQGKFIGMAGVADQLSSKLGNLTDQERNAALGRIFSNAQLSTAQILYREGAAGVEKWTAAVNDEGYAAETAAIKLDNLSGDVEQFTGSIETAFINAGQSSQGFLRGITQDATSVVNAFNKAPAPIQSTATALLAIGAATAGSIWLGSRVIRSVVDTREALSSLSASGTRGAGALRGLAVAGAGLAALTVAAGAVRTLQQATDESLPGIEELTGRLIALNDAKVSDLGTEFDSLGDSIDRIANKSRTESLTDALQTPFEGLFGEASSLRQGKAEIEDLDAALANLASTGGIEAAQEAFTRLAVAQGLSKDQTNDLRDLLPAYTDALSGSANAAQLAAGAAHDAAGATRRLGDGTEVTATQLEAIKKAYQDEVKAARGVADSFLDIGNRADDATLSLHGWIRQMQQQAAALENFTANARTAAKRGLSEGLIAELERLGPVGALRMRQLANATDSEIAKANGAWKRGQRAAQDYIDVTAKVPKELHTTITVESAQALQHVRDVSVALQGLNDRTIYLTTVVRTIHQETRLERGHAAGGLIRGGGTPTSDSILTPLSKGEYVLQADAVNKYGVGTLEALNNLEVPARGLASGGWPSGAGGIPDWNPPKATPGIRSQFSDVIDDLFDQIGFSVKNYTRRRKELEAALEEAKKTETKADDKRIKSALAHLNKQQHLSKAIDDAFREFEPKLSEGVEGVRSEVNELRKAIKDAGGTWTKALQEEADHLLELATRHDVRKGLKAFDIDPAGGVSGARSEVKELRNDLKEAGVEWTKQLRNQSRRLFETANAYDLATQSLAAAQSNLNQVLSDQAAFASQVGTVFNDSPFGNGLAGFDLQTSANTNDTNDFNSTLQQLAAQGLDGPLFKELASSGDLTTAMQLLATGPAGIALREQAFAAMVDAQQRLGGFAGDQVFGQAVADASKAVTDNAAAVAKLDGTMARMEGTLERLTRKAAGLGKDVEDGAAKGTFAGIYDWSRGRQQVTTARTQNGGR